MLERIRVSARFGRSPFATTMPALCAKTQACFCLGTAVYRSQGRAQVTAASRTRGRFIGRADLAMLDRCPSLPPPPAGSESTSEQLPEWARASLAQKPDVIGNPRVAVSEARRQARSACASMIPVAGRLVSGGGFTGELIGENTMHGCAPLKSLAAARSCCPSDRPMIWRLPECQPFLSCRSAKSSAPRDIGVVAACSRTGGLGQRANPHLSVTE